MPKRIEIGATGKQVAYNISLMRRVRNMTYKALSARLQEEGRSIPPLGLRRIESHERRVDVDDLVAFAAALNVPAHRLIGPLPFLPGPMQHVHPGYTTGRHDDMPETYLPLDPAQEERARAIWKRPANLLHPMHDEPEEVG